MITISKTKIKLVIYLFFLIFSPPIFSQVSIIHIQTVLTLLLLLVKYEKEMKSFFKQKCMLTFFVNYMFIMIFVMMRMTSSYFNTSVNIDNYFIAAYKFFMAIVEIPICCVYVAICCKRKGYCVDEVLVLIVWTGILQLIIGSMMAVFPEFKLALVTIMQENNGLDVSSIPFWEYNRRYFAFSDCMVDMLGWGLGIIAALPLYLESKKNRGYIVLVPFLLVLSMMNATTGGVIFGIVAGIGILRKIKSFTIYKLINIGLLIIIMIMGIVAVRYIAEDSYKWAIREIKSILGLNNTISSFNNVMDVKIRQLPDTMKELWIGTGHTVYQAEGFQHSDLGYVNNIWLIGIVGTILLYGNYMKLFIDCIRKSKRKVLIISVGISMFVFELKGIGICYNPGMTLTILLIYVCISLTSTKDKYMERVT